EATALNQIDRIAKMTPATLLRAALQNIFARANGTQQGRAFFQRVRDGLFKVNVLAGGKRIDGLAHVPMIGRRNDHRVDLLLKNFAIIHVGGRRAVGAFLDGIAARSVDVAHRDNLISARLVRGVKQAAHASARADHSDAQSVVSAENSRGGKSRKSAGNEKAASIRWISHGDIIANSETRSTKKVAR